MVYRSEQGKLFSADEAAHRHAGAAVEIAKKIRDRHNVIAAEAHMGKPLSRASDGD